MTHIDCEQGSEFWKELRCGITTASRAGDVIDFLKNGKNKGQESAKRRDYRIELMCERLSGIPADKYVTREMQWGKDQEPFARAAYEMQYNVLVEQIGFVLHPAISNFGCSPDGLVGDEGMIQIKCPTTATHLEWMLAGTLPLDHCAQMIAEMSCTGRKWVDFVSFDPRMPEHLQLFVRRFERNESLIQALEANVLHFNREIDDLLKCLPGKPQGVVLSLDKPNEDEVEF